MNEIEILINGFKEAGATKEQTLKIMHSIMSNEVNAENKEEMDNLLRENLSIDSYIAVNNMKIFNNKIL
jgi:hypothetical protein